MHLQSIFSPADQPLIEQFLYRIGKSDRLIALKYQKVLFTLNVFIQIGILWSLEHDIDLVPLINSHFTSTRSNFKLPDAVLKNLIYQNRPHASGIKSVGRKCEYLRAVCALQLFGGAELDFTQIMDFTNPPSRDDTSVQFLQLQTCLFLITVPIVSSANPPFYSSVKSRLEELFSAQNDGFSQVLSVYLLSDDITKFYSTISSVLKWPVSLSSERYQMIKGMNAEMFSNQKITDLCLDLLGAHKVASVSVHLLHHLLKNNVVTFAGSRLGYAIRNLFSKCVLVDDTLMDVIELFAARVNESSHQVVGISLDYVEKRKSVDTEKALLTFYHLLEREGTQQDYRASADLQLKELSVFVKLRHPVLYPRFVSIIAKQLPFIFGVPITLLEWNQSRSVSSMNIDWLRLTSSLSMLSADLHIDTGDKDNLVSLANLWLQANTRNSYLACCLLLKELTSHSQETVAEYFMNPSLLIYATSKLMNPFLIGVLVQVVQFASCYFKSDLQRQV